MIRKLSLAALALACVIAPAHAGAVLPVADFTFRAGPGAPGLALGLVLISTCALGAAAIVALAYRLPVLGTALALLIALVLPATAATAAEVGGTTVEIPWGAWLAALMPSVASVAVTILAGVASAALGKVAPWLTLFISQKRIEATIQTAVDYGINAVEGATKDGKLSVPVGSRVLAVALQRAVDSTPKWIIDAVGGPAEIAARIFRALHLDENASAAKVLEPVLASLPARTK
ncbi:hypothetical protein [Methylobacterium sp. ID0610]|uniref:hypothetical protein n=1 Tax=Methylobacterium carpenticola TaxID=3344827 RepID=UPI0036A5361C